MKPNRFKLFCAVLVVGTLLGGCATPVAPTGGPPDTTPPALVSSIPEPNSVNFSSDRITLAFSEKVDRASLQRSLSFTPEIVLMPELRWHGESVDLVFRGPLRDSTTYIATLDNEFKDNRGVAISRPITLAFSTGPTIDRGRISGMVANPGTGMPLQGIDVFVFEQDQAIVGTNSSYRTQSDKDGTFLFSNLPQKRFFVIAAEDRNRNRMIDSTEAVAVPSWMGQVPDSVSATQPRSGTVTLPTWFLHRPDLLRPAVVHLQAFSSRRTEIRLSEPVRLESLDPTRWLLSDTLNSGEFPVSAVYKQPGAPNRIVLVSDSLSAGAYSISMADVVRDSTGNVADVAGVGFFTASPRPDTLQVRFGGFATANGEALTTIDLGDGMHPEIRFNQFVEPTRLSDLVAAVDSRGQNRSIGFQSTDGTTWTLSFQPGPAPGDSIRVDVSGISPPDTVYSATYAYLDVGDTGSITGSLADTGGGIIQLFAVASPGHALDSVTDSTGAFQFSGLLKGGYRIRAFADLDGDLRWTPGSLFPHRSAEPLLWHHEPVEVRKGWDSEVDTLSFVFP